MNTSTATPQTQPADLSNVNSELNVEGQLPPERPAYLPEKYWVNNAVDTENLAKDYLIATVDAKRYRSALSRQQQNIPTSPEQYDFKNLGFSEEQSSAYANFAFKLGLSPYQAEAIFGEEGQEFAKQFEEANSELYAKQQEQYEKARVESEIEKFGGKEKVADFSKRMDRVFTGMKNQGLITDEEIMNFKNNINNADTLKGLNSLLNYINGEQSQATVSNAQPIQEDNSLRAKLQGKSVDEMGRIVRKMLAEAKTKEEQEQLYNSLSFLNEQ